MEFRVTVMGIIRVSKTPLLHYSITPLLHYSITLRLEIFFIFPYTHRVLNSQLIIKMS